MSCGPAVDRLSGYLDAELAPDERASVGAHLDGCGTCQARLASLRAVKHALARLPSREQPPGAVRARVEALRFGGRRARRVRLVWLAAAALAAAAAVAAVVSLARRGPAVRLAEDLVADHLHSVPEVKPAEIASREPAEVLAFFTGKTPFSPVVPRLASAELQGGRLCKIGGRRVQLLFYHASGQTLSLFVSDREVPDGCRAARGHEVCSRRQDGLTLLLVGKLPAAELRRLLGEAAR